MDVDFEVGIVGAGFGGLIAAVHLQRAGRQSFVIFERASGIGGTWRDNVYPGCACDVHSPLYSISAVPNPDWTTSHARQPEILAYLNGLVRQRELAGHIRCNSDIVDARFIDDRGCWRVTDRAGRITTVRVLLLAMGPLNRPYKPKFSGLDTFTGKVVHSAEWDTQYDLSGKRVAVIGTGASAAQLVPAIAPIVADLTVFQRTAAWVTDRRGSSVSTRRRSLFRQFPRVQWLWREAIYWLNELAGLALTGNEPIRRLATTMALKKLEREVHDPDLRRKLTPAYQLGCKRILVSDEYWPTFNRANVRLVTDAITTITPTAVVTTDGEQYPVDAIILSTGFVAADVDFYAHILGRDGRNLVEHWRETGAEAYRGTTVAGFPNMGLLLGPNTGLGHTSVLHIMESQMAYILDYLTLLNKGEATSFLDLKPIVQQTYNDRLHQQFDKTVWASGCRSWYLNVQGRNTVLYPGLTGRFRRETRRVDPQDYERVTG